MQAEESPAPVGDDAYPCWACGVLVQVPLVLVPAPPAAAGAVDAPQQQQQLVPARAYACGWCGAVNDSALRDTHPEGARGRADAGAAAAARYPGFTDEDSGLRQRPLGGSSARRRAALNATAAGSAVLSVLRYAVVAAVVALVAGIVCGGIVFVLPALYTPSTLPPSWRSYPPPAASRVRGGEGGASSSSSSDWPLLLQVHTLLALWLGSNVLFYYARSAIARPGPVRECTPLPSRLQATTAGGGGGGSTTATAATAAAASAGGYYPRGCWSGWRWCSRCRYPKPPRAHHCRTCAQCVVDLDHHCVFLARCVGRGNLRAFLLFLLFAACANSYVAMQTSRLLWRDRLAVAWTLRRASSGAAAAGAAATMQDAPPPPLRGFAAAVGPEGNAKARRMARLTLGAFAALAEAPAPLLAAFYLLAVALATVLGTGMLLSAQADNLTRGVTYVGELKAAAAAGGRGGGGGEEGAAARQRQRRRWRLWSALRDVMGPGGPARWLLVPRWDAPNLAVFPGATADGAEGKKGE